MYSTHRNHTQKKERKKKTTNTYRTLYGIYNRIQKSICNIIKTAKIIQLFGKFICGTFFIPRFFFLFFFVICSLLLVFCDPFFKFTIFIFDMFIWLRLQKPFIIRLMPSNYSIICQRFCFYCF